jgi:hypothetical protein
MLVTSLNTQPDMFEQILSEGKWYEMKNEEVAEVDKRKKFIQSLGLNHDPFQTPVAEQELRHVQETFYSYFSPPPSTQGDLLSALRHPQHAFIFGQPGSGKSTLRLTLDADCRTVLNGTLAITYILGEDIKRSLSHDEHGKRLAKALVIDLTLAVIEKFNPRSPFPSDEKLQGLRSLLPAAGRQLNRFLKSLHDQLTQPDNGDMDPVWGLSKEWRILGKAPVKHIGKSAELRALIDNLLLPSSEKETVGWDTFWGGLNVAKRWGFSQFFVLVDGVDTREREQQEMMNLIIPVLQQLRTLDTKSVFIKFFLDESLGAVTEKYLESIEKGLHKRVFFSIMNWDEISLQQLIIQRFRSATDKAPAYTGLDSLSEPGLRLDEALLRQANGSPRRLLEMISQLIDTHLIGNPDKLRFTSDDWEKYLKLSNTHKQYP